MTTVRKQFCSMDDFSSDDSEKFYFGRTRRPHCKTCICPEHGVKVKSKVTLTSRKPRRYEYSPTRRDPEYRTCVCGVVDNFDDFSDSEDESYLPMSPPRRLKRRLHGDHKYELLEGWFQRFDFDGNGLLDLFELRTLLKYLGVRLNEEYCKRLLNKADRDGDGRLSFPEFLLFWRLAQHEDELFDVIKEHALYPDVMEVDYFLKHRPNAQVMDSVKRRHKHGQHQEHDYESEEIKVFRRSLRNSSVDYEKKTYEKFKSRERLPVFSCHR